MRFGIFLRHPFHEPILGPIADRLRERHQVLVSADKWALIAFNPQVFVAGESLRVFRFHYYLPFTLFVHTRHGLASKGVAADAARFSHYTCITSRFMREWYAARAARPRRDFWITGYPQMDPLFQPEAPRLPFTLPAGKRVVLYAPTFQAGFTSIHMLGPQAIDLLRGRRDDVFVIIKPHPHIAKFHPEWLQATAALAANQRDVYLVNDVNTDLIPFLKTADVIVSDASSAALEFLALDRPIILVTNPRHREEPFFDPEGFEWKWRDMGEEIHTAAELRSAIDRALREPETHGDRRRHYRSLLFDDLLDGRSADRICTRLEGLRQEAPGPVTMMVSAVWSRISLRVRDLCSGPRDTGGY